MVWEAISEETHRLSRTVFASLSMILRDGEANVHL